MSTIPRADVTASLINLVRKDARRKSRRKALGKFVGALLQSMAHILINGLWLMLAIGVIHHEWIAECPTLGYWWAVLLASLLRSALATVTPKNGDDR